MSSNVLIVYMNETGESHHYLPIIELLISRGHAAAAVRIAEDLRTFAGVCYQELLDIAWSAADAESGFDVNFVAFTNEGVRRGNFRCFDTTSRNLTYGAFDVPDSDEALYRVTPLANPDTFSLALNVVAKRFDPQSHDFFLVTKAHGNNRIALTSLLSVKLGLSTELLEREISARACDDWTDNGIARSLGKIGLGPVGGLGKQGLGKAAGLGEAGLGEVGLGEFVLPEAADGIGTTKEQLLELLGEEHGGVPMSFRTVVLESCQSHLSDALCEKIPKNVERIFTSSAESLRYKTIDYKRLLESEQSMQDSFNIVLDGVFVEQHQR